MALKWLFFGVVAVAAVSVIRATRESSAQANEDSTALAIAPIREATLRERAKFGVGTAGAYLIGGKVRRMTEESDRELEHLTVSLKRKRGPDGLRAREVANTAARLNELALLQLAEATPARALSSAMKAQDYVAIAKRMVKP